MALDYLEAAAAAVRIKGTTNQKDRGRLGRGCRGFAASAKTQKSRRKRRLCPEVKVVVGAAGAFAKSYTSLVFSHSNLQSCSCSALENLLKKSLEKKTLCDVTKFTDAKPRGSSYSLHPLSVLFQTVRGSGMKSFFCWRLSTEG